MIYRKRKLHDNWIFKRGDLYLVSLNPVKGSEQGGRRPVLVLQNNAGNFYAPTLIVAPVTSQPEKRGKAVHYFIDREGGLFEKTDFRAWYRSQSKHRTDDDRMQERYWEERSLSMPEAARELGIPRRNIYQIFRAKKNQGKFVFLNIGDQKRVTRKSFDEWYQGQREYLKPEDRPSYRAQKKEQIRIKRERDREELDAGKNLFSIQEASMLLNISYYSLYRMVKAGKATAKRYGKSYLIEKSELDRLCWDTPSDKTEERSE